MYDDSERSLNAEWSTDDQNRIENKLDDDLAGDPDNASTPTLENWQVVEITGEATALPTIDAPPKSDAAEREAEAQNARPESAAHSNPIRDKPDDVLISTIDFRQQRVEAGETVHYTVTVLNNGDRLAAFELRIEGWVREEWVTITPAHTRLQPGESSIFDIAIAPPRLPTSSAGEKPFAVVVRSPEHPRRNSQLGALLIIRPYMAFTLAELRPNRLDSSWHNRSASTLLPITNQSNVPAEIILVGQDREQSCRFDFTVPAQGVSSAPYADPGRPVLALQPGQTHYVPLRITPDTPSLFALRRESTPFRITGWIRQANGAASSTPPQTAASRMVYGHLRRIPLIGPGMLTMLASCVLVVTLSVGAIGLFTLLALYPAGVRRLAPPTAIVESAPSAVEIVVKIAEPVPTNAIGLTTGPVAGVAPNLQTEVELGKGTGGPSAAPLIEPAPEIVQQPPAIPQPRTPRTSDGVILVQPDMVSRPGEVAPAQVAPAQIAPVSAASSANSAAQSATMTYDQLFHIVGAQYGIDWRILAAQAYVESGFNPLALGSRGDLGLMQVLPGTWREWAPRMDVTDPFDTYSNVVVAAAYLDYVRKTFASQGYIEEEWMLVAYNWGPNQLRSFLNQGKGWDDLAPDRQKYARDILRIAESLPPN